MAAQFVDWIKARANWIILLLLVASAFSALAANAFLFPLILLVSAIGVALFRYWPALQRGDIWSIDEWFWTRLDSIGARDWQAPYHAAESHCSTAVVMARNEAAAQMNSIMMELVKGDGPSSSNPYGSISPANSSAKHHTDYDAAQVRFNQCNAMLARELLAQLAHGHLIAKGLLVEQDVAKSERIIPSSRWRVMNLDIAKAEATGRGWSYTGIVIGKRPPKAKAQPQQPARPQPQQPARPQPQQPIRPQPQQPARPQQPIRAQPQQPIRPPQKTK